jgi:hypothetical protein
LDYPLSVLEVGADDDAEGVSAVDDARPSGQANRATQSSGVSWRLANGRRLDAKAALKQATHDATVLTVKLVVNRGEIKFLPNVNRH